MDRIEDYYAILGVPERASAEEIKRAYHQQAFRSHPDSRSEPLPTTLFHSIQAAYAVLSDPDQRRAYDQQRIEAGLSAGPPLEWSALLSRPWLYARHEEQVAYLLLEIRPGAGMQAPRLPLNLCLVIDRSTSMQGARLEYVKAAAREIIAGLQDDDALALVTFSDRAQVVLPSQVG
ncbi:MAG: DnaJ domain-containing protein, partial [Anaerolineales bacterium]|nr:DnaJ domain-containing protein [Anaerolineales bacterium]